MSTQLKAIPTSHNGYLFRSRIEARWAVFYDFLSIEYRYEDQGFDLGGVFYLPDFFIPGIDSFIEIKGEYPPDDEVEKVRRLATESGKRVFLFWGTIPFPFPNGGDSAECWRSLTCSGEEVCAADQGYYWCQCRTCGMFDIQFQGRADRIACPCLRSRLGDRGHNPDAPALVKAYHEARSYRFEGGGNA